MQKVRFSLGRLCATPGVLRVVSMPVIEAMLERHANGDWGNVAPDDAEANDAALIDGSRLLSVYETESGTRLWIITEADRSGTTVLLPEEY